MKLKLTRKFLRDSYTIGILEIDGKPFCDTLEDKVRNLSIEEKIKHQTAIPAGNYRVVLNRSPKFGRDLPRLVDVPKFEGILIHRGNTPSDTSGCILVGENKVKGKVINSTKYEEALVVKMREAISKGEKISIEVV